MKKIMLDGREVEFGSRMYSTSYGWGEVVGFDEDSLPIRFLLEEDESDEAYFTVEGSLGKNYPRSLFWDEVKIIPPVPPKPKQKKWRWALNIQDGGHTYPFITHNMTETEIKEYVKTEEEIVGKIEATEVEE